MRVRVLRARSGGPSPRPSSRCRRARRCGGCSARMNGANAPPAPSDAPLPLPSANCALPSDCFSKRDREHPLVPAGLDEVRGDDAGGAADRAGGVHAEHRLAGRAERVGEVELGLHHALEQVGRLAERRRRRCRPTSSGRRRARGSAASRTSPPSDTSQRRDLVVGLADADDRARLVAHQSSPPGCRPGSAAGTDPTSSARACACLPPSRDLRAPPRRCGPGRWP